MKKLMTLLLACASMFSLKGQNNQIMPTCSMDDYILLTNHPVEITDDQAGDIIQGRKEKIAYEAGNGYYYGYSKERDRLGMLKLGASKGTYYRFLQKNSEGKREWVRSKNYYSFSHTASNLRFRVFCIVSFLLVFLFLLPIINDFSYNKKGSWKDVPLKWSGDRETKHKVLKKGLIGSVSFGLLTYMIYLLSLNANLQSGNTLKFQVLEPITFITGPAISFLLYICLLTLYDLCKKQIENWKSKKIVAS